MFKKYYNFVVSKNNELSLGLKTKEDMEHIAELYLDEVKGYEDFKKGKIYNNDLLLIDLVQNYLTEERINEDKFDENDIVDITDKNNR